jgi:hypothetical protein
MAAYTLDSTKVGTALVTGAGTITSITIAVAPTTLTDQITPVTLVDAGTAAAAGGLGQGSPRTLYSLYAANLVYLFEPRPGIALTPGTTTPAFPRSVDNLATAFSNGIFVKSCPAGLSLTVNA